MTNILNALTRLGGTQKTANVQASAQTRALSSDELEFVSGGKVMPPSASSEGGGFVHLPSHVDPRAI